MKPATPIERAFHRLRRLYWYSLCLALAVHLILVLILVTVSAPNGNPVPEPAKVKFFTRRNPTLTSRLSSAKFPNPSASWSSASYRPPPPAWIRCGPSPLSTPAA